MSTHSARPTPTMPPLPHPTAAVNPAQWRPARSAVRCVKLVAMPVAALAVLACGVGVLMLAGVNAAAGMGILGAALAMLLLALTAVAVAEGLALLISIDRRLAEEETRRRGGP